jgi:hypothetical protein
VVVRTGETVDVREVASGRARRRGAQVDGASTAWKGVERRSLRQESESEERPGWRPRLLERTVLLTLVLFEIAWLIVLGYAAHKLFLQSLLAY